MFRDEAETQAGYLIAADVAEKQDMTGFFIPQELIALEPPPRPRAAIEPDDLPIGRHNRRGMARRMGLNWRTYQKLERRVKGGVWF